MIRPDIETQLLRKYKEFIAQKSIFGDKTKILPSTPQSFSVFPTIVFSETSNTDYVFGKSLDRSEYIDNVLYQVDIYTKDVTLTETIEGETTKKVYAGRTVINELKDLTFKFFNDIGFMRENATRGEYIDVTVYRYTMVFSARINGWNGMISH